MKTEYRIDRWNETMKRWFLVERSEDELWITTMLEENRKLYPNDKYRLVKITCTEEEIG